MGSIAIVRPSVFTNIPAVRCGITTRNGGVSREPFGMNTSYSVGDAGEHVTENRKRFFAALGIPPDRIASPQQRHTARIMKIVAEGTYNDCDGLMTNVPNVFLSVSVADCAPIFLYDRMKNAVACVHAGWRGTEQRILQKTIASMKEEYGSDPNNILAFVGPSAGPCCYEVGGDVAQKFDHECLTTRGGKIFLDIKEANRRQLHAEGVPDVNIEIHDHCTICNPKTYHSYRREKDRSGRMMGIIGFAQ